MPTLLQMIGEDRILRQICLLTNRIFRTEPLKTAGRESQGAYAEMEFQRGKGSLEIYEPHDSIDGKYVLDLACGMGGKSTYYALNGAKWVIGIDVDQKRVNAGSRFAREKGASNIAFITGDAASLPFPSGKFDMVIISDSFEFTGWKR